jgi:hypothetical protein
MSSKIRIHYWGACFQLNGIDFHNSWTLCPNFWEQSKVNVCFLNGSAKCYILSAVWKHVSNVDSSKPKVGSPIQSLVFPRNCSNNDKGMCRGTATDAEKWKQWKYPRVEDFKWDGTPMPWNNMRLAKLTNFIHTCWHVRYPWYTILSTEHCLSWSPNYIRNILIDVKL